MKYKRFTALTLALCLILALASCTLKPAASWPELLPGKTIVRGDGNVVTEQKLALGGVSSFAAAEQPALRLTDLYILSGKAKLVIDPSLERGVTLTGDRNILDLVTVTVSDPGDEIRIGVTGKDRRFIPTELTIAVGLSVAALSVDGAWEIDYDCPDVTSCDIKINGAADGDFAFGALESLRVKVNGAGDIKLSGTAERASLTVDGVGHIRAFNLTAQAVEVAVNGAGDCEITAVKTLDAEINGVGEVTYGGKPEVRKQINGLGQVKAR